MELEKNSILESKYNENYTYIETKNMGSTLSQESVYSLPHVYKWCVTNSFTLEYTVYYMFLDKDNTNVNEVSESIQKNTYEFISQSIPFTIIYCSITYKYYLLTTDNHGIFIRGGGILWESDDGIEFGNPRIGYDLIERYFNYDPEKVRYYYGPGEIKFERPQILIEHGKPAYLYVSSGHNIFGGDATVSYVLKINL